MGVTRVVGSRGPGGLTPRLLLALVLRVSDPICYTDRRTFSTDGRRLAPVAGVAPLIGMVLRTLDPEQTEVVDAPLGAVRVIAGAGSGKTTAVTARIAQLVRSRAVAPAEILAVTHSTAAAGELHERLVSLGVGGVATRTFHSAAARQLRSLWHLTGRPAELKILEGRGRVIADASRRVAGVSGGDVVADLGAEISWAKVSGVSPDGYARAAAAARRTPPLSPSQVADVFMTYEATKERSGNADFDDLLLWCTDLIESNDEAAAEVRGRFGVFFVDEFQDTDPAQARLLAAWAGTSDRVCVVGDPRQAIYGFKGADPSLLARFDQMFRACTTVHLVRNYRSTPQVCQFANQLITSSTSDGLVAVAPDGPPVEVCESPDEAAEERRIVAKVAELAAFGVALSDIAVLFRYRASSARFEAAFADAGIPAGPVDDESFFSRPEVREPLRDFGRLARQRPDAPGVVMLRDTLGRHGWDRDHPPAGVGAARARWEAQSALIALVERIPNVETLAASWLLADLQERAKAGHSAAAERVALVTAHAAKGKEWSAVFVAGVTEGAFPSYHAKTPAEVASERRLLYVAVTRARRHLFVSYATSRDGRAQRPSRFLSPPTSTSASTSRSPLDELGAAGRRPDGTGCSACRARLVGLAARRLGVCSPGCLSGDDRALFDQVVAWRDRVAERVGDAPSRVLSDAGVFATVAAKPRSLSEFSALRGVSAAAKSHAGEVLELIV